ncbi:MAG: hypothetical protein ACOVOI_01265, partial [Hyphomicrobiales bacterium]
ESPADQVPEGDERLTDLASVSAGDEADLLALNNEHAVELSWLDAARLRRLLGDEIRDKADLVSQ